MFLKRASETVVCPQQKRLKVQRQVGCPVIMKRMRKSQSKTWLPSAHCSMLPKDAIFQYFPHMWCRISPNINFRSSIHSSIVVLFNMHFLWKHRHHQHLSVCWSLLWALCMIIRMLRQKIMRTGIKVGGTIEIYSRPGVLDITLNLVRVAEITLFPNN